MKLFVLAASVGYALAAARGEACGAIALQTDAVTCETADYCDLASTAPAYCPTAGTAQTVQIGGVDTVVSYGAATGTVDGGDFVAATCTVDSDSSDAFQTEDAATTGLCAEKIADGSTCVADGDCATDGSTCRTAACEATALTCGAALTNADGALGGCCNDAIAAADAANFCLGAAGASGVVTVKVADGEACSVAGTGNTAGAASSECASGTCTVTDAATAADVGTCDATATPIAAGATGGACLDAVTGITAVDCGADLTCTTATATDGATGHCQTTATPTETADADAAAGAVGGACNAAVTEVLACTTATDTCTDSLCVAADDGDDTADDEDSAALFYGLSMVTGAIAYLL